MSRVDTVKFTAVFTTTENGWVQARIVQLPGIITAAPTRSEAAAMLPDAFAEYLLSLGAGSNPHYGEELETVSVTITVGG